MSFTQQPEHDSPMSDASSCSSSSSSSRTVSLIERAAELNEDGVYELADGSFPEAVQSFESAMRHIMQLNMDMTTSGSSSGIKTIPPTGQEMLPPSRTSVEVPYLHDDDFYLYSCTVTFNPSSQPSSSEISYYCATVLFNLALAHHQHGQRCRKQPGTTAHQQVEASLRQAHALYQECANVLQSLPVVRNDDMILMQLASLNNQAHILHILGTTSSSSQAAADNTAATQWVFQTLMTQSMAALQQERPNNNFSQFEQSQINEFVRNSLVFGLQPSIGAACA